MLISRKRRTFPCLRCWLAVAGVALLASALPAQEPVELQEAEARTNFFAGREVELRFTIKAARAFEGRAVWRVAVDRATLVRKETGVRAAPDRPGKLVIRFTAPTVRKGLVLRTPLVVEVLDGDGKIQAGVKKVLWIFPEDPFADRLQWLRQLHITLFDPAHTTADVLKKAGIPFEEQNNLSELAGLRRGLLIVGEGASFKDEPALAELLIQLAARELPVLCLAPSEGTLTLPTGDKKGNAGLLGLTLRRQTIISQIDRRLDAAGWLPGGKSVVSSLSLGMEDGNLTAEVGPGETGWPWLEMEYPGQGRLLVCGFGIIKAWGDGPTPRFLLAALLERLAGKKSLHEDKHEGG